jgi:hypothetical protein
LRSSRKDSPINLSSKYTALSFISKMLRFTTSLLNHALLSGLGHALMRRSSLIFMPGVNYGFSDIVLDLFAVSAEVRPINAYEVLEAGDRTPEAPEML